MGGFVPDCQAQTFVELAKLEIEMIWYKFHIGDYLSQTTHLSDAEDLAYRRLIDLYYLTEKPIPLDTDLVARKIRLDLDITELVLEDFFEKTGHGYVHDGCDAAIAKHQAQVATNRILGKRGGRPKKTEPSVAPPALRFDEFWNEWPSSKSKVAKAACRTKWGRQALDLLADKIIASVARLKATESWLSGYVPPPLTYLRQKRWEDGDQTQPAQKVI